MSQMLLHKLSTVRRKRVGVKLGAGAGAVVLWGLVVLCLTMGVDWWIALPWWIRALVLAINLAGLAYFAFREAIAPLIWGPDDDALALLVETFEPSFDSRLISSIQLSRAESAASPALVAALIHQTETLAEPIEFSRVVSIDRMIKLLTAAVLVTLMAAVGYAACLPASTALLQRALLVPGVAVPRKTSVEVVTGNVVLARGESVDLIARAHGIVPASGMVRLQFPSGATQEFILAPVTDKKGSFTRTIDNVQESFKYVVSLNDGVSEAFSVRAEPRPTVAGLECLQVYPAYTDLGTVRRSAGDLSLLAGSRLTVKVTASKRMKVSREDDLAGNRLKLTGVDLSYWLQNSDVNDTSQLVSRSGADSAVLLPTGTTGMSINLIDEAGIRSKDSVVYRIDLVPDKAPTVSITNPTKKEELATRRARVIVGFDAADDFGIARVALKYKLTEAQQEQSIPLEATGRPRNLRGYYNWELAKLNGSIEEGAVIEWWVEVADANNVTGPGVSASEHYQLRIVSEDEKRAELLSRLNDAMSQINDVSENQQDLTQRLGKMINQQGLEK